MMSPFSFSAAHIVVVVFVLSTAIGSSIAFQIAPPATVGTTTSSSLNLFDKLGDAFKNEGYSKPKSAGLSGGPQYNDQVTVNGKPVPSAVFGQKLTVVAGKARVKIPVNCQKGDCGTCIVKLNGRQVKACQTPLPAGKAVIETL